eukprot:4834226-Pleurochrysis_carterae.AAC.1
MNWLLKYEDASLLNHCIIIGAPGDASLVNRYDMGSGLHLAARCPIEQMQNYSPLVLTIFAEKYTCRRIRLRVTRTSTRCPRVLIADYS